MEFRKYTHCLWNTRIYMLLSSNLIILLDAGWKQNEIFFVNSQRFMECRQKIFKFLGSIWTLTSDTQPLHFLVATRTWSGTSNNRAWSFKSHNIIFKFNAIRTLEMIKNNSIDTLRNCTEINGWQVSLVFRNNKKQQENDKRAFYNDR